MSDLEPPKPSSTPSEDKTAALQDILNNLHHELLESRGTMTEPVDTQRVLTALAEAEQAIRNWAIAQLPEKKEPKNLHLTTDNGGFLGNYCDTCKIYTFDKDTFEETGAWCLCYPFNQAITTATTNLKGDV